MASFRQKGWAAFAIAYLFFALFVGERPIGGGAQRESVQSHAAIQMVQRGDWLTPRFLGRFRLDSPPLSTWTSALSVRVFGNTPFAHRFPAVLASALVVAIVYVLIAREFGSTAATTSAILLAATPVFYTFSRVALPEALLSLELFGCAALLASGSTNAVLLGALTGLAFLTTGYGGLVALVLVTGWWLVRPQLSMRTVALYLLVTTVIAVPWFAYQASVHARWFFAEFQFFPPNARRLFLPDPILPLAALAGLMLWRAHDRQLRAVAVATMALVLGVALSGASAAYLVPALPALAVLAAPAFRSRWAPRIAVAIVLLRLAHPYEPWGLDPLQEAGFRPARAMARYEARKRPNELILIFADDEFHATVRNLPKVRYLYWEPQRQASSRGVPFRELGVAMSASEFLKRDEWQQRFAPALRAWGLDTDEALGTSIEVQSEDEIRDLIARSPDTDFYLSADFKATSPHHDETPAANVGWRFLLARPRDGSMAPTRVPALDSFESPR